MKKLICFMIIISCFFSIVYADVAVPTVTDSIGDTYVEYPLLFFIVTGVLIAIWVLLGIKIWKNDKHSKGGKIIRTIALSLFMMIITFVFIIYPLWRPF